MKLSYLFFVSALLASACARECDLAWEASTSETKLQQFGFQVDVGEYLGRGRYKGRTVPGVIKRSDPTTLHFPMGNKYTTTREKVEFLKTNDEFKFTWTNAESVCVQDGVVVGKEWYIGRTTDETSRYLGLVRVGEDQMDFVNDYGMKVQTDDFEILTCSHKEASDCHSLKDQNQKLQAEIEAKEMEINRKSEVIKVKDDKIKELEAEIENLTFSIPASK